MVLDQWENAYRVGYLIAQDRYAAEDIAQEALLAALDSGARFDPSRPLKPWIQAIAAHKAHDWVRRRHRHPEVLLAPDPPDLQDGFGFTEIAERFATTEAGRALARLEPIQREAIVLRHLLDMSPNEIAQLVDVPAETIRTRVHRGLRRLRAELEAESGGDADERAG